VFILKHILGRVFGFLAYTYLIGKYGYYQGQQIIYQKIQQNTGILDKLLKYYVENPLKESVDFLQGNYQFYKNSIAVDRLSNKVIEQYSDDSLSGYGDIIFQGGVPFEEQQRSQILPTLHNLLKKLDDGKIICEIGCGNGDIVAFLAEKYPHLQFIGVDFSVKNAENKHKFNNLKFLKGYALELLENKYLDPNVIFTSSTSCLFNPKELDNYLYLFKKNDIAHVVINEPMWGDFMFLNYSLDDVKSYHLEGALWKHNYEAYFKEHGYIEKQTETKPFKHPLSSRVDIKIKIAHYILNY
jgi:SAM-dependent methyltransferase